MQPPPPAKEREKMLRYAFLVAAIVAAVVSPASALGEGLEAYGEGQRQIGELQTAQGFLTGNVPEFQEGLVNQAIGPYVSGYGSYLKSTYGGRKLLIGEGLASLGQGMQQLGQAQAGLAFVGKDRPTFDKGVETAWKGAGLKIYGDTLSKWTG